ncbi:MAG: S41 family peptidase, partial [Plesiomonas shigelloides]
MLKNVWKVKLLQQDKVLMKLRLSVVGCMLALGSWLPAQAADGYFRFPDLKANRLVYTAEGDVWLGEPGSERASRLTTHAAEEIQPHISPDGSQVAFVANYDGADEVYLIPVSGGEAIRITAENSRVRLQGWTADGRWLYATDNAFGPANFWVLKLVDPNTRAVEVLPLADAIEGVVDDRGEYVYFIRFGLQATGDNVKVYRGGARGELWRYRLGSDQEAERLIAQHPGSLRQPMFWQGRVYFISDADGNDNLYSLTSSGAELKQHTHFSDFPMRAANLADGKVVFQLGASLHLLDLATGKDTLLPQALLSDYPARRARWVTNPMEYATDVRVDPKGERAVITARNQVVLAAADGKRLVQIAVPGDSRVRNALLSNDGRYVYGISDASGEQELW